MTTSEVGEPDGVDDEREPPVPEPVRVTPTAVVLPAWLVVTVVVVVLALLAAVILVGLARNNLNSTGVATVLSSLFSGIVLGVLALRRGGGSS